MIGRVRSIVGRALLAGVLLTGLVSTPAAADAGAEADFLSRIDGARARRGLGSLQEDDELTAIARRWSRRMADEQRLAHNPNLAKEVRHDWEKLAENVGVGGDVASIHEAFMNSPSHRDNILDGTLTHVGVGVVVDGSGQLWVTEVFMRLRRGGSGGGGGAPPDTATPPTTSSPPRAAPPPTTAPPAPPPPPVPATAPVPAPAAPSAAAAPEPPALEPPATRVPVPAPAVAGDPPHRLVLVLHRLVALDGGR